MNGHHIALITLGLGAILGITLGVPIGRQLERLAWHADNAMIHARFASGTLRQTAGRFALGALLFAVAVAFIVWA